MPGLDELMARGDAAGGMMRDGGDAPPGPTDAEEQAPDVESQPSDDLDGALAQVESVVEGMNPDIADQVREHLNAIRDIVASAGSPKGGPDQGSASGGPALPAPDTGDMSSLGAPGMKGME